MRLSEWTLSPDRGPQRPRSRMDVHFSSTTDDWFTPDDVFRALDAEFGFEVDVCASAENAKCQRFFTRDDNGLRQKWTGVCWMNPPYGRGIWQWVQKACESAGEGSTVVCLLPALRRSKKQRSVPVCCGYFPAALLNRFSIAVNRRESEPRVTHGLAKIVQQWSNAAR